MAKTRKSRKKLKNSPEVVGVDREYSLYELTDLFYSYYRYHNEDCLIDYEHISGLKGGKLQTETRTLSRFAALRRIQGMNLGSRPFAPKDKISKHRPNINAGYLKLLFTYLKLPFKSVFTDSDLVKVRINKLLYNEANLSEKEKEDLKLVAANNPHLTSNKEVSDDVSDAFVNVLRVSKKVGKCQDGMPLTFIRDAICAFLHSDLDWQPIPVQALDLVTEPQAEWDCSNWGIFFVIRKMTAQEAMDHIRNKDDFWDTEALRWALESAVHNRGIITYDHYNKGRLGYDVDEQVCNENFSVKSFYNEKGSRVINVGTYYGNMLVVEGYFKNKNGKIDKAIFFPSQDFVNVDSKDKKEREQFKNGELPKSQQSEFLENATRGDILFYRRNIAETMQQAITVIPFERDEPSLERQRAYGHELFSSIEILMRLESSIFNFANLMGIPFIKNRAQGTNPQNLEDLQVNANGDFVELGDRDFVEVPFQQDLNGQIAVRNLLLQHIRSKAFLGGLDGQETLQNGRGANLANLRLIRDARVHKHDVEDFSKGLTEFYTQIFRTILKIGQEGIELSDDVLIKKIFFETLTELHKIPQEIFEFDDKDIIPDTGLPYWMEIQAIRNGASHFGAAELVLYTEIKQVFGDSLTQKQLQSLNRMGIKSLLGSQDAFDILGDPRDTLVTEKDQIYRALVETVSLVGSVDGGTISFESIPILEDKDDHVAHLSQAHNPKAEEMIQRLQQNEVTPEFLSEATQEELETRHTLILKLAAIANHSSLHQAQLERFGSKRPDVNELKENTNSILQAAEGLLNSLTLSLRALQGKREEQLLRLQNLSPENEAERLKNEKEIMELQARVESDNNKLALANKIADQRQQQHVDKQLTRARDREMKRTLTERDQNIRILELQQTDREDVEERVIQ